MFLLGVCCSVDGVSINWILGDYHCVIVLLYGLLSFDYVGFYIFHLVVGGDWFQFTIVYFGDPVQAAKSISDCGMLDQQKASDHCGVLFMYFCCLLEGHLECLQHPESWQHKLKSP